MIYFIRETDSKYVKIGFTSRDYMKRVNSIQTDMPKPVEVLLVVDGKGADEKAFHDFFHKERFRGEWFLYEGCVREYIDNYHADFLNNDKEPIKAHIPDGYTSRKNIAYHKDFLRNREKYLAAKEPMPNMEKHSVSAKKTLNQDPHKTPASKVVSVLEKERNHTKRIILRFEYQLKEKARFANTATQEGVNFYKQVTSKLKLITELKEQLHYCFDD